MGWLPASRHILLRPGQKPGVWCVTGGSWAVGPYSWGRVGWSRESGCLSKREPQTGGIEHGRPSEAVCMGARNGYREPQGRLPPKKNPALLFSVEKTQGGVTPQVRAENGLPDKNPCQRKSTNSSNKPPRHEGKRAMFAISRLEYHFQKSAPPTAAGGLPYWAAPSGTCWRRSVHCPLEGSSQPLHCSCPCRG